MKIALLLAFSLCVVIVTGAQHCSRQEECAEGECCVRVPFSSLPWGNMGRCKSMKKDGEACNILGDKRHPLNKNIYVFRCPCTTGTTCKRHGLTASCEANEEGSGF